VVEEAGGSSAVDSSEESGQSIAVATATREAPVTPVLELNQGSSTELNDATLAAANTDDTVDSAVAEDTRNDSTHTAVTPSNVSVVAEPASTPVVMPPTVATDEHVDAVDTTQHEHAVDSATATTDVTTAVVDDVVDEAVAKRSAATQAHVRNSAASSKLHYDPKLSVQEWEQQAAVSNTTLFTTFAPTVSPFQLPNTYEPFLKPALPPTTAPVHRDVKATTQHNKVLHTTLLILSCKVCVLSVVLHCCTMLLHAH
jgi:hypothetical protein